MTNSELDKELARLLGWERVDYYRNLLDLSGGHLPPTTDGWFCPKTKALRPVSSWHPTTDMQQCFDVVVPEVCAKLECDFMFVYEYTPGEYVSRFSGEMRKAEIDGSAPLSISLAAYEALKDG